MNVCACVCLSVHTSACVPCLSINPHHLCAQDINRNNLLLQSVELIIFIYLIALFSQFTPVNFSIHSKHTCPTTSSSQFAEAIRAAMNDMKLLYTEELGSN